MFDLSSIMLYKVRFSIKAVVKNEDLLWKIVLHIRSWQTSKWNCNGQLLINGSLTKWTMLKNGDRLYSEDQENTVYIESEFCATDSPDEQYWACKIIEKRRPAPGCAPRQLVTEIGYEQKSKSETIFSCVVSYSDAPGFIGPIEKTPSSSLPRLITSILADETIKCSCGFDDLLSVPLKLSPGDWQIFWEHIISPARELPYIFISPKRISYATEETKLLVDPFSLAKAVCGNAVVYYANSIDLVNEMNYLCDKNYICYGGAIRIYQSNIQTLDKEDSYRHRFLTASYIQDIGSEELIQIFRRALTQNVRFYETFFRIDECRKKTSEIIRHRRLLEIQNQHKAQMDELKNGKLDEAIEEEQKRLEAESREEELQKELADLKREKYNLAYQLEANRSAGKKNEDLEAALQCRNEISAYPKTPLEVITYFSLMFVDKIAFTDDAIRSAKDCTISSDDLWQVLFYLATEMQSLLSNDTPNPYSVFKTKTGIDVSRGEGSMTRKDKELMKQFETRYYDKIIDIEPHITFSRQAQSIHFGYSANDRKIIIGHCGKHLDIYSTIHRK